MPPSGRTIFRRRKFSTFVSESKSKPTLLPFIYALFIFGFNFRILSPFIAWLMNVSFSNFRFFASQIASKRNLSTYS